MCYKIKYYKNAKEGSEIASNCKYVGPGFDFYSVSCNVFM